MKLHEILAEEICEDCDGYEEVYIDANNNVYDDQDLFLGNADDFQIEEQELTEASKRQWKRFGKELRKRYRCTSGPKQGKLVADPSQCASRKDPKKVRQGRKVMRTKKNTIARKSKIAKRTQLSKIVTRVNARLMGKKPTSGASSSGGNNKQKSSSTNKSSSTQKAKTTQKTKKPQ